MIIKSKLNVLGIGLFWRSELFITCVDVAIELSTDRTEELETVWLGASGLDLDVFVVAMEVTSDTVAVEEILVDVVVVDVVVVVVVVVGSQIW